jgi:hypothetical protein
VYGGDNGIYEHELDTSFPQHVNVNSNTSNVIWLAD